MYPGALSAKIASSRAARVAREAPDGEEREARRVGLCRPGRIGNFAPLPHCRVGHHCKQDRPATRNSELDEEALAGKIGHQWKNTESSEEDDGSVVDW